MLAKDMDAIYEILEEGGKRAEVEANKKLDQVKSAIGVA